LDSRKEKKQTSLRLKKKKKNKKNWIWIPSDNKKIADVEDPRRKPGFDDFSADESRRSAMRRNNKTDLKECHGFSSRVIACDTIRSR